MNQSVRIATASQLDTYVHYLTEIHQLACAGTHPIFTSDIQTRTKRPAQRFTLMQLEEYGFVVTHRCQDTPQTKRTNTYQLARPLSDIFLHEIVSCLGMYQDSPMVKLIMANPTLTLATLNDVVCSPDEFVCPGAPYSFDFIVTLLSTLNTDTQISHRQIQCGLGHYSRAHTYLLGAIAYLFRLGLVDRQRSRTGYRLYNAFETLTVHDIIPAVSHRSGAFNKVLYLSKNMPLSLFV